MTARTQDDNGKRAIKNLKTFELQNDWEGRFSILHISLVMNGYFKRMKELFDKEISFVYISTANGLASAYLPVKSYEELGRHLVALAQNKKKMDKWCREFKKSADDITRAIQIPAEDFLSKMRGIMKLYDTYTAYQVATKTAFNFLPPTTEKIVFKELEEVRKYSEDFYKISEKKIEEVIRFLKRKLQRYTAQQLQCLTADELAIYQKTKALPRSSILQSRYNKTGLFWNKKGLQFISAGAVNKIERCWLLLNDGRIKGTIAFPGIVRGICRIIKDYKNADLKNGEILVTGMTDPHYVPLMKKARAIVTDGGGLLCHAAIVAREMQKPCIIGTKIATKILKDGDLVEVDADKGIVKIIKKA